MPKRWRLKDRTQTFSTDSDVFHHSTNRSILPWFVNEMLWTAPCSWALHLFRERVSKFQTSDAVYHSCQSDSVACFRACYWTCLPTQGLIKISQLFLALDGNVKNFLSGKFPLLKIKKNFWCIKFLCKMQTTVWFLLILKPCFWATNRVIMIRRRLPSTVFTDITRQRLAVRLQCSVYSSTVDENSHEQDADIYAAP